VVCPNCGEDNPERARFCLNCGTPLAQPASARERKLVTVLFADVTGSTSLGEQLDPERLKDVMSAYFDAMREEIQAEGGTVEKFIGDAVMAAFGVPKAHEDDAARAVRAARRMQDRLRDLNQELERAHGVTLQIRIGISTGEVLAQPSPTPGEGMVTGDSVNVAARLEQVAEPGQVMVSERTAKSARGFLFRPAGNVELKGKAVPVPVLVLEGADEGPERGVPGLQAPIVGRDAELDLLSTVFERVATEGRPHLATIYGDAGVGKSRLTQEFVRRAAAASDPPLVLRGRCLPYGEGVTYWPLAEILKAHARILDSDPPETALEKLRTAAGQLMAKEFTADPRRSIAALAYTVGLEDPEFHLSELAARQVRLEIHTAWRSFFSALGRRPVIVLVEDIHWADTALLDLLEELADRVQGGVLFLCPSRPELTQRRPTWGGGKRNFSSIFLDPLTRDDSDRLVRFLLTVDDLTPEVHEQILAKAEGNPFFLEEIIRHFIDEGRIVRAGDRWRVAMGMADVLIPDTVQGVIAARIDLLAPEEKRTLQSAAVVGRVFWAGPVSLLLNGGGDWGGVEEVLDRLEGRELILARLGSSMAGEREFIFKHILTRDVAYEMLPRRDWGAAHAAVARWIEEMAGGRRAEVAELLAHHYGQAHRNAKEDPHASVQDVEELRRHAFEAALTASSQARHRFVVEAALRFAEEGVALAIGDLERGQAFETLGAAYNTDYRGTLAYQSFREALTALIASGVGDRRAIARLCAEVLELPTRWPGSMHVIPSSDEVAPLLEIGLANAGEGDSVERVALLSVRAAWPWAFPEAASGPEARDEAVRVGEEAAAMALRLGRPALASGALDAIGGVLVSTGLYGRAAPIMDRRLELAEKIEDPFELGDIFSNAAWLRFHIGEYHRAVELADEGLRAGEAGRVALHSLVWRVAARVRLGEWDAALQDIERGEEMLGDRREHPPGFAWRLFSTTAFIHDRRGNRAGADRYLAILERFEAEQKRVAFGSGPWVATIRIRRGEFEAARSFFDRYEVSLGRVDYGEVLAARCELVAAEGRWDEAADVLERARVHAAEGGLRALPAFADRLEGRAALAAGDLERSVMLLTRSGDAFAELEAAWEEACTDLSLAEALEGAGRRVDAREAVTRGLDAFDRLQSVSEQVQARDLLARLV
jgi:class 3 adenylate cyclase/tetratricopeptide (TPR) repeat protein